MILRGLPCGQSPQKVELSSNHRRDADQIFDLRGLGVELGNEYVRRAEGEIDALVPIRYCEHELVSLLLSAFRDKAKGRDVSMRINVSLPKELRRLETELCTLLSNGLENAINADAALPDAAERSIDFWRDPAEPSAA